MYFMAKYMDCAFTFAKVYSLWFSFALKSVKLKEQTFKKLPPIC